MTARRGLSRCMRARGCLLLYGSAIERRGERENIGSRPAISGGWIDWGGEREREWRVWIVSHLCKRAIKVI